MPRHCSLLQVFTYFASSEGELDYLTFNAWSNFLEECELVDNHSAYCKKVRSRDDFRASYLLLLLPHFLIF